MSKVHRTIRISKDYENKILNIDKVFNRGLEEVLKVVLEDDYLYNKLIVIYELEKTLTNALKEMEVKIDKS